MQQNMLTGCSYNQLNMNTPIFNISSLGSYLPMKIPKEFCKYQLCGIYDLSNGSPREVNFFGKISQDFFHPWIDLPCEILDLNSGKHTYRFDFLDVTCDVSCQLFASYVAQDDDPATPYVYMSNRGNTSEDNSWKDGKYADDFYTDLRKEVEQTYGYDPLLFGESLSGPCATCTLSSCDNCPYKEG